MDNEFYNEEPKCRIAAWMDLLMLANHAPGSFRCRGVRVFVDRGQVGYSSRTLASRWKWSRNKVLRYLKELEARTQIVTQKTNVTTLITIVNWDKYQSEWDTERDTERTQKVRNKNDKNVKKNTHTAGAKRESYPQPLKTPITIDFYPDESTIEYCAARQLPDPTDQEALDEFINTNQSRNWLSANWQAEYRRYLPKWRLRHDKNDKRTRGEKYLDALRDA